MQMSRPHSNMNLLFIYLLTIFVLLLHLPWCGEAAVQTSHDLTREDIGGALDE